jgi:hypothetical protein
VVLFPCLDRPFDCSFLAFDQDPTHLRRRPAA